MKHPKKNAVYLIFLMLLLFTAEQGVFAGGQDVSAVKAMQLFDSGNFSEAEKLFRILLDEDPANPMLNYYYGASRTENGHFGDDELSFLLKAGKNITPDRLHYYLGMQYHARNDWEQALKHYNQFRLSVPEGEQQRLQLTQKIQHCFDHVNPYLKDPAKMLEETAGVSEGADHGVTEPEKQEGAASVEKKPEKSVSEDRAVVAVDKENVQKRQKSVAVEKEDIPGQQDPLAGEEETIPVPSGSTGDDRPDKLLSNAGVPETGDQLKLHFERELLPDLPGVEPTYPIPPGDQIEFQVNDQITYLFTSQFQTAEGEKLFEKGRSLQEKMNRLVKEADELREQYRNSGDPGEKAGIGEKILSGESEIYNLQEEVSQLFSASREQEKSYWNQTDPIEKHNFIVKLDKIKAGLKKSAEEKEPSPSRADTEPLVLSESLAGFYGFDNDSQQSQPSGQLVYKIQIGAYSRGIPAYKKRLFDRLALIRKIDSYTDENGVVVYTTGNLHSLEDALKMQSQVRQEGVKDAFVVPYFNGKRITLEQAKKIEAGDDIERN